MLTTVRRSEGLLRRALFEDTGGMYPELITRPDIKMFLPPIGNLTAYICVSSMFSIPFLQTDEFYVGQSVIQRFCPMNRRS